MDDLTHVLRLILVGDSASAVKAIGEVDAATKGLGASSDLTTKQGNAMARSGQSGLLLMAGGFGILTAAVTGCVSAYGKQAEAVIQVEKLTGLHAKAASDLTVQLQTLGVPLDSVGTVLGRMIKNVEGVAQGTTKASSAMGVAFKDLGISMDSLKGKDAGAVLDEIRAKIAAMPAGLERTDVILSLFGRGATANQGLLRYLTASNSELDEINKKAAAFGLVFTQKQLDQAGQFGNLLRMIKLELEGEAVSIGKELVPAIEDGAKAFNILLGAFNKIPASARTLLLLAAPLGMIAIGAYKAEQSFVGLTQATIAGGKATISATQAIRSMIIGKLADKTATDTNTVAQKTNSAARRQGVVATGEDDAALTTNDESLVANDAALATNDEALETNNALRSGGGLAGASEDLGLVGTGGAAAGEAGAGLGAGATIGAVSAPILAGLLAGMIVQSHATQRTQGQTKYLQTHGGSFKKVVPHLAGGGFVKGSPEGTLIVAGDENQDEIVAPAGAQGTVTAGAVGGRGGRAALPSGGSEGFVLNMTLTFPGATFNGAPDSATARRWAQALAQPLGEIIYETVHGAGH